MDVRTSPMRLHRRIWSTAIVGVSAAIVALLQPVDDYTANSLLAFALGGAGLG